jgi:hypothetical protein
MPRRKLLALLGTINEFEFPFEAARLVVEEGLARFPNTRREK